MSQWEMTVKDSHCDITMGDGVTRDIHCDVIMSNDAVVNLCVTISPVCDYFLIVVYHPCAALFSIVLYFSK